jgi:hypothetical protein
MTRRIPLRKPNFGRAPPLPRIEAAAARIFSMHP